MLQEIFNSIQKSVKCPKCNATYSDKNINLLGQIGPNFLLKLDCPKCKSPLMVNVLIQENEKKNEISGIKMEEIEMPENMEEIFEAIERKDFQHIEKISQNNIIDFVNFVQNFSGSVGEFVKKF